MPKRMLVKREERNDEWDDDDEHDSDSETSGVKVPQMIELDAPTVEPWRLEPAGNRAAPKRVWQDVLQTGTVTLLYSRPKQGKSFFTMGLIAAMTTGREYLGRPAAHTGVVMLTEECPEVMHWRIERFGADMKQISYFYRYDPKLRHLAFEEIMANAAAIARRDGRRLLIIDTLLCWTNGEYNIEMVPEQAQAFFGYLRALAQRYGFAVLVLHHSKKRSIQARGWAGLEQCLDTVIRLEAPEGPDSSRRALHCSSRHAYMPERIDFEYCDGRFEALEHVSAAEAVWRRLPAEGEGITGTELVERTGFKRTMVYAVLSGLVDEGRVRMQGEGTRGEPGRYWRAG